MIGPHTITVTGSVYHEKRQSCVLWPALMKDSGSVVLKVHKALPHVSVSQDVTALDQTHD